MTTSTKYLTGTYNSGYSVQGTITSLHIASTAIVNGKQKGSAVYTAYGTTRTAALAVLNYGRVEGGSNTVKIYSGFYQTYGAPTSGIYLRSSAAVTVTNGGASATGAYIEGYGAGVNVGGVAALVTNFGVIAAAFGPQTRQTRFLDDAAIMLLNGGTVVNGAAADTTATLRAGYRGVVINGAGGTVTNFGTIEMTNVAGESGYSGSQGVLLTDGGAVTNGSGADTKALIQSGVGVYISGAAGTVSNFATILGQNATPLFSEKDAGYGVVLLNGGRVTNGSTAVTGALISGAAGGVAAAGSGSVFNFGRIVGDGSAGAGVTAASGQVVNGATNDRRAIIEGYDGVVTSQADVVVNYGAIEGQNLGLYMKGGGALTNAAAAVITGYTGIVESGAASVVNAGAIDGLGGRGVVLAGTGSLLNEASGLIAGFDGVDVAGASTVTNQGQILTSGGYGIELHNGGTLINGLVIGERAVIRGADIYGSGPEVAASGDAVVTNLNGIEAYGGLAVELTSGSTLANGSKYDNFAEIEGVTGISLSGLSTAANFGTILALQGSTQGTAAAAADYSVIVNRTGAVISGFAGVRLASHSTLVDYGQVTGFGGTAVYVGATDELVIGPGAAFSGSVTAARGELSLAGGAATLTLPSTGSAVVSGLIATTTFANFAAIDIAASSTTSLSGTGAVLANETLSVEGDLAVAGRLNLDSASQLAVAGTLGGAGTLSVGSGALATFSGAAQLSMAAVSLAAASSRVADTAANLGFAGKWTQNAGTLSVASGDVLTFTGAGDTFKGVLAGAGALDLSGGSDTLTNLAIDTFVTVTGAGTVTATGTITIGDELDLQGGNFVVGSGTSGAVFTGGTFALGDASKVIGASASSTLTNRNSAIIGAGQLGDGRMRLVNDVSGGIAADGSSTALVINTGTVVIINDGSIASYDAGGLIIESTVQNVGTLLAEGGNLTVQKGVTGAGSVEINSATADFASTFTQNVDFVSAFYLPPASGTLELAKSQTYTGTITGFTTTGTTALDLLDIAYKSGTTKATYSGTTASGVLTVTDGTHTAHITFAGDYVTSTWTLSSDGHGGTTIVDPPGAAASPITPQPLIAAMAGFGAGAAGPPPSLAHEAGRSAPVLLVRIA